MDRDAIVQKKYLPLPFQFAIDRVANDPLIVSRHDGFDGQTIERRRLDRGHVFRADERKIKRARNRRGGKRQHVDELEELFEFLLVQHAEALLLIDHDQAEIFEDDVAGNEPMRADDDIDAAFAQQLQHFFLFGVRTKTAEHFDAHRIIEHALPKHFEMLLRQNGGRREHGDLFAVHDRLERGANGDFGFAETDVAADQAVHRPRTFHVDLRVDDRLHLVRRFAERE